MKVTFGVYPDNLGHITSNGCVRCHDGRTAADGSKINDDCEYCHKRSSSPLAVSRRSPDRHHIRDPLQPHMAAAAIGTSRRVLEPIDRVSEVLFGLIMVLTFTGSLSVAEAGRDDVRTMLIGALGCNLAWGIIDAMLYLMGCLAHKGQSLKTFLAVHKATDPQRAQRLVADALPAVVASVLSRGNWKRSASV